jgi:2-polyprenyl-6-methoxyphenol hydroxylase-like FAD-dependent oxidoreductase
MKPVFTIIGGGIAGLTTAIALQQAGFETLVFEAAPEFREVGAGIALSINAMKALAALRLSEEISTKGRLMETFTIYDERGRKLSQTSNTSLNGTHGPGNFVIHRAELQSFLVSKVNQDAVHFNKRMIDFKRTQKSIIVKFAEGSEYETEYLIVADGIHSVARKN